MITKQTVYHNNHAYDESIVAVFHWQSFYALESNGTVVNYMGGRPGRLVISWKLTSVVNGVQRSSGSTPNDN